MTEPFTSPVYGYTIRHPADWTATPAVTAWDGSARWGATMADVFGTPSGTRRLRHTFRVLAQPVDSRRRPRGLGRRVRRAACRIPNLSRRRRAEPGHLHVPLGHRLPRQRRAGLALGRDDDRPPSGHRPWRLQRGSGGHGRRGTGVRARPRGADEHPGGARSQSPIAASSMRSPRRSTSSPRARPTASPRSATVTASRFRKAGSRSRWRRAPGPAPDRGERADRRLCERWCQAYLRGRRAHGARGHERLRLRRPIRASTRWGR